MCAYHFTSLILDVTAQFLFLKVYKFSTYVTSWIKILQLNIFYFCLKQTRLDEVDELDKPDFIFNTWTGLRNLLDMKHDNYIFKLDIMAKTCQYKNT